jgi:hypothetical protein
MSQTGGHPRTTGRREVVATGTHSSLVDRNSSLELVATTGE